MLYYDLAMIIYILLFIFLVIPLAFLFFWKVYFLRSPDRLVPDAQDIILAPADGKIIEIHEYTKSEVALLKGDKRYRGLIKTITDDVFEPAVPEPIKVKVPPEISIFPNAPE